jgi:4-diphosphocytidyl-2-C-methyl-D-erythritol kinase
MLTLSSPAKINTYLYVTGKRADGYHLLDTVFQLIGLYDTVKLEVRNDGKLVLHTPIKDLADEQHLAIRAAQLLKTHAHTQLGANIWVDKQIPVGAGLGGGSSNAATTLMGLNVLWRCGLSQQQLQTIGLQLGADVPFFCTQQGTAHAQGIGEILTSLATPLVYCVVIFPNIHVSTPTVFEHFNLTYKKKYVIISQLSEQYKAFHFDQQFKNVLQAVTEKLAPPIKEVANALSKTDNVNSVKMTGTGSAVFAIYLTKQAAENAVQQLKNICEYKQWFIRNVQTLSSHPNQKELFLG